MADEDIDSLLEAGITAANMERKANGDQTSANGEPASPSDSSKKKNDGKDDEDEHGHSSRRKKNRSRSPVSRSRSRSSRRSRRSGRDKDRRRSRSRSARRRSSRHSRSRSRSSSRRGSRRSRRSRSRDRKRRSRSRSGEKRSEPRARSTSAERAERAKQRELMELTRDHRTVFVGQLTQKVRERDLEKFFGKLGKIEHVLLIRDKFTNRSKGFAYVEMSNLEDVPKVLILNGQIPDFQVFPIMIKASEAEKNFAAKKDSVMNNVAAATTGPLSGAFGGGLGFAGGLSGASLSAAARIYCGNLHTNITEDDLRCVFQSFGEVVSVNINRDEMGRSKGFGFIQFSAPEEANFALSKGNGLELAGNYLKLGTVNDHSGGGGSGGDHHHSSGAGSWKLEDDEGTGLSMNSQSRTALMAKLAGGKQLFPTAMPTVGAGFPAASIPLQAPAAVNPAAIQHAERAAALASVEIEGSESFCFVIKNMFDVAEEQRSDAPDWHVEIKQDVEEECSTYGNVLHSYVEKDKQGGLVYVLFDSVRSAVDAAKVMHGRWFNQRQISVRYLSSQEYVGMFPEARSAVQTARSNDA
uniref:RRM domain-containing protein n=1 Tax=Globisporangium ultimum (strain ATCC 200006 / CBS 805.95 / DAOM BR144) TaxID=431595 RepID=K3X3I5_GLOUD